MAAKREREKPTARDIETAFARSFLEKGYRETSVESIARELGIPKGSVFYHIGTKEAVFFRVQMEGMREFTDRLGEIAQEDISAELRLKNAIFDSLRRVDPSVGPLFSVSRDSHYLEPENARKLEAVRHEYQELFIKIIQDGIDDGVFAPQQHLKVVVFGILRFIGLVRDWYKPEGDLSLDQIAEVYWEFTCRGLGLSAPSGADERLNRRTTNARVGARTRRV